MRLKVTRIEIWEVPDPEFPDEGETAVDIHEFADSVQDDILNSQDVHHETDDAKFGFMPKEIVLFKVERV